MWPEENHGAEKGMRLDEGFVFDRRDPKKSWGRTFLGVLAPKLIMDCLEHPKQICVACLVLETLPQDCGVK